MGNRGCEALVRSNSALIRERFPNATFLCPSVNAELDTKQWPDHAAENVNFVPVAPYSERLRWWNRVRRLPFTQGILPPARGIDKFVLSMADRCDAVLMTGGDIISLDYDEFSLYHWSGLVEAFARVGKPVHLLAASVGPFTKSPHVERRMREHLSVYTSISVRETASYEYVTKMGRGDATLVADPAFTLVPDSCDSPAILDAPDGVLGLNVSGLVRETRGSEKSKVCFDEDVIRFIKSVVQRTAMSVLLIPHVDPLDGGSFNSDRHYMKGLLERIPKSDRIAILEGQPNTRQLKHVIGRCRYFIGARTHATVAGLSQGIPTCSIAYSVKALGINRDLIGDTRYVLPTPEVNFETLWAHLELLQAEEKSFRNLLDTRIPEWKARARLAIPQLNGV
jgi:colanic acid/amylovoran biosynthesis protein